MKPEILNRRINPKFRPAIEAFSKIARDLNINIYLVGGSVRDLILKKPCLDLDFLVDSKLSDFLSELESRLNIKVEKSSFLTAKAYLEDFNVDIAQARKEIYKNCGSLPEVSPAGIKEDALRRDFTVNTLLFRLSSGKAVELIDFTGGLKDIKNKVIRILHKQSFFDDPTRIIRAVRYSERFGFKIDGDTLGCIKKALSEDAYASLSTQRLCAEFVRVLKENRPYKPIIRMFEIGALGFMPHNIKLDYSRKRALREWGSFIRKNDFPLYWIVPLVILVKDLNDLDTDFVMSSFELTKRERRIIKEFQASFCRLSKELLEDLKSDLLYDKLKFLDIHSVLSIYFLSRGRAKKNSWRFIDRIYKIKLDITGEDVKTLGLQESPQIGIMLDKVLSSKISGRIKSKQQEIALLKELINKRCG
ncbi:MAG: hypothetical protein PHQ54_04860 [Candidatus Omnitrophica bacterium]|nr:hypothetical protein [Candidatus Omnitrophota bacterium]